MIKGKRQMLTVIGVFALVIMLGTITYAFFNYTRTGANNNIKVGRISFVSKNEETITLNNIFPIDPSNTTDMNDSTKVGTYSIDIKGDTDYSGGIEYLVSTVDTNIYTNQGQILPISLAVTVNGLGTSNANYFTARENTNASIYKKIVGDTLVGDQMLLVGYIKPNSTSGSPEGVDGSITIKAYLDENNILISDTYDGTESDNMGTTNEQAAGKTVLTTNEWNALSTTGISFKVKVEANEGIWINGSLEEIMKQENFDTTKNRGILDNEQSTFVNASTGINFGEVSSNTNGKGVYMRAGTENNPNPILYYRGDVTDNNVVFNNKCWKAVRTTDTGGVKLIYNGEKSPIYSQEFNDPDTYAAEHEKDIFTFDSTDSTWNYEVNDGKDHEITFKVPAGENYDMVISGTTGSSCGLSFNILKDGIQVDGNGGGGGSAISHTQSFGTLTSSNVLKVSIYDASSTSLSCTVNLKINVQQGTTKLSKNDYSMLVEKASGEYGCYNKGSDTQITVNNTNTFAFNTSYNSPTYNGYMYGETYASSTSGWTSGARFGSGFTWDGTNYKLVDAETTTPNSTHHYSCNSPDAEATCTNLRYVYYGTSTKYYITLTGGDGIEEALVKMQTNTNDSNAKDKIETWYASQMNTVTNKLEDTIWCNDRSFGDGNNNGWIANGGDLLTFLYYGAYQRSAHASNNSTVKNEPSLACANKNDSFTWRNSTGNKALDYPVAMLSSDEIVLAGGLAGSGNETFYLSSGAYYWSLSPYYFYNDYAYEFYLGGTGFLSNYGVHATQGLRPAISIKPGQLITKGTGTVLDPYVIE